jgi:membrane protease YdiL (CAAX protease family)
MPEFPGISDHLLVWVFGLAIPFISGVQSRKEMGDIIFTESVRRRFYLANSFFLAAAAAVILFHWWWKDRPFSVMGFRPGFTVSHPVLTWSLVVLLMTLYLADVILAVQKIGKGKPPEAALEEGTPFLPRKLRELPAYLLMCLSAGVFEEIIYRGYMVTYFLPRYNFETGLPVLAVIAPAFLFSLAHYYQGWQAVAKIFLLSVLLAAIFLSSGSIWLVMAIHTCIDLAGGLLAMWLLRKTEES